MNEEFLTNLAEAMLNEGIDENSIINVLSSLVEEQEEVLPVSEACFNSIISLTEAIINEYNSLNEASKLRAIMNKVGEKVGLSKPGLRGAKNVGEIRSIMDRKDKQWKKATDTIKQKNDDYMRSEQKYNKAVDQYNKVRSERNKKLKDIYKEAKDNSKLFDKALKNLKNPDSHHQPHYDLDVARKDLSDFNKKRSDFSSDKDVSNIVKKYNKASKKVNDLNRDSYSKFKARNDAADKADSVEQGLARVLPRLLKKGKELSDNQRRAYGINSISR